MKHVPVNGHLLLEEYEIERRQRGGGKKKNAVGLGKGG